MNLIFPRDLGDGQFPAQRFQGYTAFEFGVIRLFHKMPSFPKLIYGHFTPSQVVQFSGATANDFCLEIHPIILSLFAAL